MDPSLLPVTDHPKPIPMTNQVTGFLIGNVIALFFAAATVAGRFMCRIFFSAGLGTDDWLILVALILAVAANVLGFVLFTTGAGHPMAEVVPTGNLPHMLLIVFLVVFVSITSLAASKLSMLFFYLRIFDRKMRLWCWAVMGFVVVWAVAILMTNVFMCTPISAQWDLRLAAVAKCGDALPLYKTIVISSLLTDIIIMMMPMKTIWGLNMRTTEKLGLMMSFLLLFGVVIVGCIRYYYVSKVDLAANITRDMPLSLFTTNIELSLGIICVSIPMLRPLYTRYRAKHSASKLSDQAQRSDLQTYGGGGGGGGGGGKDPSGKNSRNRVGPAADITLTTFYDSAPKDEYGVGGVSESAIEAGSNHSVAGSGGESERNLTSDATQYHTKEASNRRNTGLAIEVHKQWEIRRD
ncbi:hypothetical protein RB601_006712 [Gaeumannomyces tritici]